MQNFINYDRVEPQKKDLLKRIKNFEEISYLHTNDEAVLQADRCVQCGDPYCLNACPLSNFIPFWLKQVSKIDFNLAFKMSNESSPFPEIMGRICPQDKLCEGACTLNDGYGAITIGSIETFISEEGFKKGLTPIFNKEKMDKKVAIIGSGPAGLSCATFLLRAGIDVDIYERDDKAGGLLTYGIPGFKLDKDVIDRRIKWLLDAGMNLKLNCEIGKDISFKDLQDGYDAVFVGIGATKSNKANIENEDNNNVISAMNLLTNLQRKQFNLEYNNSIEVKDKNVIVIGGGDTAMDCVRSSIREGAKSVKCLYRRDEANMPGSKKDYKIANDEGGEFIFNITPKEIVLKDNKVVAIKMLKTKLGEKESSGRQKMEIIDNSDFEIEADIIIMSLGFTQELPEFIKNYNIKLDKWNGIQVDKNNETSISNVYAGGDCKRGADLVVNAALDGRESAKAIVKKFK